MSRLFAVCLFVFALAAVAQDGVPVETQQYVVDVELQTEEQFYALLQRSEQLLLAGVPLPEEEASVTFVLHGPVLKTLMRDNYLENKPLVDLAASLSALSVIEVKACKAWMSANGLDPNGLQPFVEPIRYGPGLVERLVEEKNYLYF